MIHCLFVIYLSLDIENSISLKNIIISGSTYVARTNLPIQRYLQIKGLNKLAILILWFSVRTLYSKFEKFSLIGWAVEGEAY